MARIERNLDYQATATANASGTASVTFNGPPRGYIAVDSIAVQVTGSTSIPKAVAYEGTTAAPGRVLATLRAGDAGTFTGGGASDRIDAGKQITIVWTGASSGASCVAVLRGKTIEP